MRVVLVLLVTLLPLAAHAQLPPPASATVDYDKDVKPILAQNCYSCHGVTAQQAGLRLDLRQNALRGGDYGPVIVPGKSGESKLIKRLVDGDGGLQMPPSGALSPEEIGILRAWIDQGPEFRTEIAERPAPPVDPRFAAAVMAVRAPGGGAVNEQDPALVNGIDQSNNTLLHHAAGFGSLETMTRLIEAGADVNAKNRFRSTPLHWAVHDSAKVSLLLSRGAEVNAKQIEGRTPLFMAASMGGHLQTVKQLLERGADPTLATANGQTALMAAAARGNVELLASLIDRKVDVNAKNSAGETALMFAASSGSARAVALLLERGADPRVRSKRSETALGNAATAGIEESVRLLLQHGAEVNVQNIRGFSPLMLAANSDSLPDGVVRLLLASGADTSYTADYDETALDLAAKRGDTAVTRLLAAATTRKPSTPPAAAMAAHAPPTTLAPLAAAVTKALTQLEKQSFNFIRISGCNSCHSQDLPIAAAAFARSRGIDAPREIPRLPLSMMAPPERLMDLSVVALMGPLWELYGMGMAGEPKNAYTDAAIRLIRSAQRPEGSWSGAESRRPPMASGDFMASALAVFAMTRYAPEGDRASQQALELASAWLARAKPEDTQDQAFHALALHWVAPRSDRARTAARHLISSQRSDGGWSQLPAMPSDAYATGLALYTLHAAGKMSATDPVYRKGVDYLLRTQAADGTWHVKSRAIWLQPYFESGFPYGQDQFISAAGTAWAAMALTGAVDARTTTTANLRRD